MTVEDRPVECAGCGKRLECCEACERKDCDAAACFECLSAKVGQLLPQPHLHGG